MFSLLVYFDTDIQSKMSDSEVFSMIRGMKCHWYEIFHHLGFSHKQLTKCKNNHPLEPEQAMMEMISIWLEGNTAVPSWESLVSVLRYQLLENDIAGRIEKVYCVQDESMNGKYILVLIFCNFSVLYAFCTQWVITKSHANPYRYYFFQ